MSVDPRLSTPLLSEESITYGLRFRAYGKREYVTTTARSRAGG
jgi:hypothetical protein